jgi:hypothetical protein
MAMALMLMACMGCEKAEAGGFGFGQQQFVIQNQAHCGFGQQQVFVQQRQQRFRQQVFVQQAHPQVFRQQVVRQQVFVPQSFQQRQNFIFNFDD